MRVVQFERNIARKCVSVTNVVHLCVEDVQTGLDGLTELHFFAFDHFLDRGFVLADLGIVVAHDLNDSGDQCWHRRVFDSEKVGVANRAAHDAAQHVSAIFVRGEDPIVDHERRRAGVIGENT